MLRDNSVTLHYEDTAEAVNIQSLLSGDRDDGRERRFSGSDNGIVTMTKDEYNYHIKLFNRFALLSAQNDENETDVDLAANGEQEDLVTPTVDKWRRFTAGEIEQGSLARNHAKKRKRRKVSAKLLISLLKLK